MVTKRFQLALFLVVVAVAAFLGFFPSTVLAQAPDQAVSSIQAVTDLAAGEVEAFWTEEMMSNAIPMPLREISGAPGQPPKGTAAPSGPMVIANSGEPGDIPHEQIIPQGQIVPQGAQGPIEPLFGTSPFSYTRYRLFPDTVAQYKQFPYRMIGKLYFTIPGQGPFVCSGSSVNSTNNSVVWTAGHCVFTPGVGYHTNFLFVPALHMTSNPYGKWTVKQAFTLVGWQNGYSEYDHGALVMNERGKKKIGNVIGFLGFAANVDRGQNWTIFGYPADARNLNDTPPGFQFDGVHQEICATAWATNDLGANGPQTIGVGCDQTGGCSGGPWLIDFSGFGGATNTLNGNNSYRYTSPNPPEDLKLYSPYFSDGANNLRNAAQAVPVP